jgi:hypothetical protein
VRILPPRELAPADQALALLLLAQVRQVADLCEWPPLGAIVEDVVLFAQGRGDLSGRDARRLGTWVRRWAAIDPKLRAFYGRHSHRQEVGRALWAILDLRDPPEGPAYGRLSSLWEEDHGYRPSVDLVPRFP